MELVKQSGRDNSTTVKTSGIPMKMVSAMKKQHNIAIVFFVRLSSDLRNFHIPCNGTSENNFLFIQFKNNLLYDTLLREMQKDE